jgi:hypothetical protein
VVELYQEVGVITMNSRSATRSRISTRFPNKKAVHNRVFNGQDGLCYYYEMLNLLTYILLLEITIPLWAEITTDLQRR